MKTSVKCLLLMSIFLTICLMNSCFLAKVSQPVLEKKINVEEWQNILMTKIKAESALIHDTLWWAKISFTNLEKRIERENAEKFLMKHDSAKHYLGRIPKNASTYFVEYYLQEETSMLDYGMFWIKGDKFKGIKQNENWEWNTLNFQLNDLKKMVTFNTDLKNDELITSGGGYMLIAEFKKNKIIDANFVAVLSLSQFLIANKVF